MEFAIHEANMERLEKKLTRIKNKCSKYGNYFRYKIVREEMRTLKDNYNKDYLAKYYIIETVGTAQINDWEFEASIDHTEDGNIIRSFGAHEVPEKYYTCKPYCEHCKTSRERKSSYIVYNAKTNEFKQVGRNCLCDFTNGLSAEQVACYISGYNELIQGEEPYEGCHYTQWLEANEVLATAFAVVDVFGFVSKASCEESMITPTAGRVSSYYELAQYPGRLTEWQKQSIVDEQIKNNYKLNDSHRDKAKQAIEWILTQDESNNYMHNLITVCKMQYITHKELGILTSLASVYNKHLDIEMKKALECKSSHSEWMGEISKRITVDIANVEVIASWETEFGYTKVYKITDTKGNVYTWKTTGYIEGNAKQIIGTVKAHNDYRGIKQTELTRCKSIA